MIKKLILEGSLTIGELFGQLVICVINIFCNVNRIPFPQTLNMNPYMETTGEQVLKQNNGINNNHANINMKTNGIVVNGNTNHADDCSTTDSGATMEEDNSSGMATTANSSQHENDLQVSKLPDYLFTIFI